MVGGVNLRKLRNGTPIHKNVILGNGENSVQVAVVSLPADIMQRLEEMVQEYCSKFPNKVNDNVRSQYYNTLLAYHCMRDPSDIKLERYVAESVEEVSNTLDLEDISRICTAYGELMVNKAPKLEMLTHNQFDTIKKHLEVTPLSDLSTVLLVHLTNCHRTIVSET